MCQAARSRAQVMETGHGREARPVESGPRPEVVSSHRALRSDTIDAVDSFLPKSLRVEGD